MTFVQPTTASRQYVVLASPAYVPEKAAVSAPIRLHFGLALRRFQNNSGICLSLKYAVAVSA